MKFLDISIITDFMSTMFGFSKTFSYWVFVFDPFTHFVFFSLQIRIIILLTLNEKKIFVWREFVKTTEKIIFLLLFVCFRLAKIACFLNFPSNKNLRKQHLSANVYCRVKIKFSYTITVRKDEIFYGVFERKQARFFACV